MIRFEYFTREQAIAWQASHPKVAGDPLTDMRLEHFEKVDLDQQIGVFAIDGDRIVGTNFFYICPICVNGKLVECVVSNNLFAHSEYRPKGIGTFLKLHVLKLGYPQISSGVSPSMQKVYDAWSAYTKIDASPVFAVPLTGFGLLRVSRMAAERESANAAGRVGLLLGLVARVVASLRLRGLSLPNVRTFSPAEAERRIDEVLKSESFPIQVPWNRRLVERAIWRRDEKAHAWMIEIERDGAKTVHLITGYLRPMMARGLGRAQHRIQELHLTEIFPPVREVLAAKACLRFIARCARSTGASIVHIYAMTDALRDACRLAGVDSFFEKRVYIAPNTKDAGLDEFMRRPSNWWCRIRNEDQLEENAFRRAGQLESAGEKGLPPMIY